jgi:hypothetical protein
VILFAALLLIATGCATAPEASLENRTLPFGCDDSVVIGTVENGAYQPVESKTDILGHGWISATLHVRKSIRGTPLPSVLPVRYFAHTNMRQDRDFMFVLKHTGAGYEITSGQLMSLKPRLANRCE